MGRRGLRGFTVILLVFLSASGPVGAHEATHQRPTARGPIDPKESFQFLVLSGAGGHFHTLVLSPGLETMFTGTHLGLFRSDDRGLTWRLAAPRFSGEEVHRIVRGPGTRVLYAATHSQGLLVSRDGGRAWSRQARALPGQDIHALAASPRAPAILYVWVVGHGLYRSVEGGSRWSRVANQDVLSDVESLAVHPETSDRLYAGTAKGVWLSEDGGTRWRFPDGGLPHRTAGVAIPPWRSDLLFAATHEGAFVGKGDGTGWEPLPPPPAWWGLPQGFAFLPDRPEMVFVVTHEGVVAALRPPANEWTPAANIVVRPHQETGRVRSTR